MWRQSEVDAALDAVLCSILTDRSAKNKNKHLDALRDLPPFNTHTVHTLPTDQFGGYVCGAAAVAQIVPGHKTRPVCECEEWERMVASEEKGPVMSLPRKIPQTYFGYNYLFDCSKETVKYASTIHMIHDGTQKKKHYYWALTTREHFKSLEGSLKRPIT